jgi:hypothetical protein
MSRSIHQTRKSALKEFMQENTEPIKELSLKSDLKKFNKKYKQEYEFLTKLEKEAGMHKTARRSRKKRNTEMFAALKKVKNSLNRKVDRKYSYPDA